MSILNFFKKKFPKEFPSTYWEGYQAVQEGKGIKDCPYLPDERGITDFCWWSKGYAAYLMEVTNAN